ncbi:MAG: DnaB-like helicase N-terminal domain-containing protein, partial [Microbacteriaceae bacterium]
MDFAEEPAGERRVPPHDVSAEMSTLGGMLMSKDAVGEVMEYVKAVDFYLPKHEIIFTAIVNLFGRAEPTDVVTVTNELTKTGQLQKIGGANYLHTLINFVPTAANAGYYAEIVADKAILRKLVESGTRITQLGYAAEGEPVKLVDEAQADIFNIGKGAKSQEAVKIGEAWENVVDEIERAAGNTNDGVTGVATGFRELDELTHGFQPGQLILIA